MRPWKRAAGVDASFSSGVQGKTDALMNSRAACPLLDTAESSLFTAYAASWRRSEIFISMKG